MKVKHFALYLVLMFAFDLAYAMPIASTKLLDSYKELYKDPVQPIKYIFVDANCSMKIFGI
ncbi:hypothetical protein [Paraherbaspirillum soli]|uniref:Uncharacterized protein n=1 Tax=Paraherbaspirillum soli TaxID=631222 RepID=A0ABW0MB55_9BURK